MAYFLALLFAPLPQSAASAASAWALAAAALAAAASAFWALPETFLPFSPMFFFPAMVRVWGFVGWVVGCVSRGGDVDGWETVFGR